MYKMQRLGVSGAVQPIYGSLGIKQLKYDCHWFDAYKTDLWQQHFVKNFLLNFMKIQETLYLLILGHGQMHAQRAVVCMKGINL